MKGLYQVMTKKNDRQVEYNRRYREKNPEKAKYVKNRTVARTFVRHSAYDEDIIELLEIYRTENENSKDFIKLIKYYADSL